ncbi:hypothetical protein, partial [uncultured Ligilactobacillus sp.]|uniref:hypothetical protein n=1 Tax=uncultured Ligilactobacillus sp. TaxID=2837633 RepID=UPI00272C0CA1
GLRVHKPELCNRYSLEISGHCKAGIPYNGNSTVAWYVGTIEYNIVTNRTTSELKEIIESMYNE